MILRSLVVEPLRPSSSLGALGSSPHRDKNLPIKKKKKKKKKIPISGFIWSSAQVIKGFWFYFSNEVACKSIKSGVK